MFKINNYLVDCCFKKSYHSPVKDPHGLFTGAAIMFHVNLILTLNKYYEKPLNSMANIAERIVLYVHYLIE